MRMASRSWHTEDREFLKSVSDRRDWSAEAVARFPDRSEAAIRCMMQKVRIELGTVEGRFMENAWMADAVNGSRALLTAQLMMGVFPE
jgi:hypothetical protein